MVFSLDIRPLLTIDQPFLLTLFSRLQGAQRCDKTGRFSGFTGKSVLQVERTFPNLLLVEIFKQLPPGIFFYAYYYG